MTGVALPFARSTPRAYFERAFAAFDEAARRTGVETHDYAIGGTAVRLHFAGPAMPPVICPALAHLHVASLPSGPQLNLHIWDSASTGVAMPPPAWPLDAYAERGEISVFRSSSIRAAFSVDGPILDLWDPATGRAMMWIRDHARVPYYERCSPARRIFGWWLAACGLQMIHAGGVGAEDGCVLLAGKGGRGKSNAALACLGAGLTYLSDDYCILDSATPPVAHSLYATGKVNGDDLSRLPFLSGRAANLDRLPFEKAMFFLADAFGSQLRVRAQVNAFVMPQVRPDAPTSLVRASSGDAARAVAMSTIGQLPYAGGEVLASVAAAARQRPAFDLHIGSDAGVRVPEILRRLATGDDRDAIGHA